MNPATGHENKRLYEFGAFRLDPAERVLARDGQRILLAPKAFDTLLILVHHSGHVLTKDELLKTLWPDSFVEENNLTQQISQLRRALGEDPDGPSFIETVPRLGYRFLPEVREIAEVNGELAVSKRTRMHIVLREEEETEEDDSPSETRAAPPARTGWLARRKWLIASAVLILLALPGYLLLTRERIPIVVDSQRLARIEGFHFALYASSTDIYFKGRQSIMRLPITGGDPAEVVTPIPSPMLQDFSRERSEFLLLEGPEVGDCPLWILPVPTGSPRRLGDVRAHAAAWSPDGERVVYAAGHDLFLVNREGEASQKLASIVGWPLHMRWSPDGRLIRYVENDAETRIHSHFGKFRPEVRLRNACCQPEPPRC